MGKSHSAKYAVNRSMSPLNLLDDEKADLREEVKMMVKDPDRWLNTPNSQLGGRKPIDFIGTSQEQLVGDLLRAVKYGLFS
jgi:hypothetical protein